MIPQFHPTQVASFRKTTENHATYSGVHSPSFRCQACGQNKLAKGRKQVVPGTSRFGYKCADCAVGAE